MIIFRLSLNVWSGIFFRIEFEFFIDNISKVSDDFPSAFEILRDMIILKIFVFVLFLKLIISKYELVSDADKELC